MELADTSESEKEEEESTSEEESKTIKDADFWRRQFLKERKKNRNDQEKKGKDTGRRLHEMESELKKSLCKKGLQGKTAARGKPLGKGGHPQPCGKPKKTYVTASKKKKTEDGVRDEM